MLVTRYLSLHLPLSLPPCLLCCLHSFVIHSSSLLPSWDSSPPSKPLFRSFCPYVFGFLYLFLFLSSSDCALHYSPTEKAYTQSTPLFKPLLIWLPGLQLNALLLFPLSSVLPTPRPSSSLSQTRWRTSLSPPSGLPNDRRTPSRLPFKVPPPPKACSPASPPSLLPPTLYCLVSAGSNAKMLSSAPHWQRTETHGQKSAFSSHWRRQTYII